LPTFNCLLAIDLGMTQPLSGDTQIKTRGCNALR
jgi:hypothetical protein